MENFLLLFANSLVRRSRTPRFRRHLVGATGCSTLLLDGNNTLHYKHTADGDRVYFYDQAVNGVTFGTIIVQMKNLYTLRQAENILVQYIHKMRRPLGIACTLGQDIRKETGFVSVADYWQDAAGCDWKVQGSSNGKTIAVLYVKNIGASAVEEHDAFLSGFRFSRFH